MKRYRNAFVIAIAMAVMFVAGALTMYYVMWYGVYEKFIEMIEKITV